MGEERSDETEVGWSDLLGITIFMMKAAKVDFCDYLPLSTDKWCCPLDHSGMPRATTTVGQLDLPQRQCQFL